MLSAFYTTDLDTLEIPNSKHLVKNQGLIQLKFMLKTPISGADAAVSSSRSVCTRATEMRYVYPLAFHTAREDGETDSTRQTCVPQPSANVLTRYHVLCYASQAGVKCGEHA